MAAFARSGGGALDDNSIDSKTKQLAHSQGRVRTDSTAHARRIASAYANVNSPIASSPLKRTKAQGAPLSYARVQSTPPVTPTREALGRAGASPRQHRGTPRAVPTTVAGMSNNSPGAPPSPRSPGMITAAQPRSNHQAAGLGRRGDINSPMLYRNAVAGPAGVFVPPTAMDSPSAIGSDFQQHGHQHDVRASNIESGVGSGDLSGSTATSLLSTFFSPVLTFFGGSAADNDENCPAGPEQIPHPQNQGGDCKDDASKYVDAGRYDAIATVPLAEITTAVPDPEGDTAENAPPAAAAAVAPAAATDACGDNTAADNDEGDDSMEVEEFNPYTFIKGLPPYHFVRPDLGAIPRLLPPKAPGAPRITLVLDLDETLVHCSIDPIPNADLQFPVEFNGVAYRVYVRKRPHFERFMKAVTKHFEVVVFTASQQVYAERLLNILDPDQQLISHRLYRDACLCVDGNYLKDLQVLGRDLKTAVLVDNSPYAFGYQVDNGIPIESWFDDDEDQELLKLLPFLDRLREAHDVRSVVRNQFKLQAYINSL